MPEQESPSRKPSSSPQPTSQSVQGADLQSLSSANLSANLARASLIVQRAPDPRAMLRPADVLAMQRTIGNQAVQRMLSQKLPSESAREESAREEPNPPLRQSREASTKFGVESSAPQSAAPRIMRTMHAMHHMPQRNLVSRAPKDHIQRAGNWSKFKNFAKGQGKGFKDDQQWWMDEMNPSNNKGLGKVGKPLFTTPFAALQLGLSGVGRGLTTLGAGAYYGAKGFGSGASSAGKSIGRGASRLGSSIKESYNRNRNPHGYNRDRLPTTGKTAMDAGKPLGAIGASGAMLGGAESAGTGLGFPAGSGMLSLLTAGDAALTWRSGNKMHDAAKERNDLGGMKVGTRKANQGKWGVMGGVAATAQGALNLGTVMDVGSQGLMSANDLLSGANYVSSGLGIAGAAAGIAGGAVTAGQGLWKSGKAASKLYKLSKSAPMLTPDGDRWRARIKDREKTKLGLNSLKTIAGVLGIAAGALVIASNPIGWALGVVAAATAGGLAAYKLYTKFKKSRRKKQAKKAVRAEMERESAQAQQNEMPALEEIPEQDGQDGAPERDEAGMQDADPSKLDKAKRKQATELGNLVAQKVSKSAAVAGEIRGALAGRTDPMYGTMMDMLGGKQFTHEFLRKNNEKDYPFPRHVLKTHDALVMMSVLNLSPEEVESESGQELIEKKLSVTESL